jgi:predicted nucleic-acid-binding Zn-ribbon protein
MKQTALYKPLLLLTAIVFLMLSCTPGSCFEETNAFLRASSYLSSTGKPVSPDSLTLYGVGMASDYIYLKKAGIQPLLFPLNASSDNCKFVIRINGVQDTLIIWYSSYPHLISKECGYTFFHTLDSVSTTYNIIDDVIIRNKNVTTFKEENIRIFY